MVLPEQRSENVARRARALEHCLEECGGCANRPETCWEPHLAVVGTFFTLTLARPTTSRDPSRHCFIRGHVCCARHPLDKVSDATFSEATFSWVTLTFLADGAGVGAEECRGTYVRLGDSDSLEDALSCSAKHTLIREHTCSGVLCLSTTRRAAPPSDPLLPPSSLPFPAPPRAPLPPARWLAACCKANLETAPSTPRLAAPSPTRGARLPREADASPPPPVERLRFGAINAFPLPTSDLVCDLKKSNQVPCKGLCCTMVQIRFGFGFHTVIWVQTVWNLVCT